VDAEIAALRSGDLGRRFYNPIRFYVGGWSRGKRKGRVGCGTVSALQSRPSMRKS